MERHCRYNAFGAEVCEYNDDTEILYNPGMFILFCALGTALIFLCSKCCRKSTSNQGVVLSCKKYIQEMFQLLFKTIFAF